jgi:UrcA family protein
MANFIKTVAAISIACGLTFAANAKNNSEIIVDNQGLRTVIVTYGDLNLATVAGQQALSTRVRSAVRKVCGDTTALQRLSDMQDYRDCTRKASQNAWASLEKQTRERLAANF